MSSEPAASFLTASEMPSLRIVEMTRNVKLRLEAA